MRNRFYNLLKEQMLRLKTTRNTMTVPGAIRELEKVEMTRRSGSSYLVDYALTRNQKMISSHSAWTLMRWQQERET